VTFDLHQHLWPAAFCELLRERSVAPYLRGSELVTAEGSFTLDLTIHDPEQRLRMLDRDEIDVAVLSLQPSLSAEDLAPQEREELELAWVEGVEQLARASGGRFRALAPWRVRAGFDGTSVGASALIDLDGHAALLDDVMSAKGVLFVHPEAEGEPTPGRPDWWNWAAGYTGQMQRAYLAWLGEGRNRWPTLQVVFAILAGGAPIHLERLTHCGVDVRSALDPNVFFDVATYGRRAIELCIETFGVGQLVYGSDLPVVDPGSTLRAVRGFGDAVATLIQIETPRSLLT
jgi:6-methylsalicylate decarboxylase